MSEQSAIGRRAFAASLTVVVAVGGALALPQAANAAPELAPVMLVLDASGSMQASMTGGGTKMKAAKEAVHTLVRQAPDDARIGLAVYGTGTGNAAADKAAGCKDVKVVQKVGPLDRSALTATVDGVEAHGYTPIGQSLRVAVAELPAEGQRSIVLISDGEDTCAPPDPCEVARQLHEQGVDLRVHAIGFQVDGKARQQLTCLAQATGGTYVDAPDAASLASGLNRVTQRALRFYEPVGTPVAGTKTPNGAPKLRPGTYLDRIRTDESRFYSADVPPGYTLYASATAVVPPSDQEYFVHISRYDGKECGAKASSGATVAKLPAVSISMQWKAPAGASPPPEPCDRAGAQLVQVILEPVFGGRDPVDTALEVLIGLEPPLRGDAGPPGNTKPVAFNAPAGPARPVVGGGSFSTATALDGSGSYTDTVFENEMVFYRVRLGWGQGLAYRLRLGQQDYHGSGGGVIVTTYWYNPPRSVQASELELYDGKAIPIPDAPRVLASPAVRYRNREVNEVLNEVSVAGWYYLAVRADRDLTDEEAVGVPVTLDLSVNGQAQPEPGYAADAEVFGDQAAGMAAGKPGAAATRGKGGILSTVANTGPLLWAGVPVLLLLLGAFTGLLVVRRHRRSGGAP
jgi:Ca-activated chloride channel homolog